MAAAIVGTVSAMPAADKVDSLYQMPDLSFGLYSGYLPVAGSTKNLHYLAALSQGNWKTDPVIVWFNGGPGCSSMLGFMQEHGPYSLADGATQFVKNPYSWNKEATMVYIESPAGVGYSTCGDPKECTTYNDFNSAADNMQALIQLLSVKFPELQGNDLYISGESYAGIYVPRLVEQIDWYIGNCTANKSCPFVPQLKGFIVGNGVTDYRFDNDMQLFEMTFWYGFISTETYNYIKANCLVDKPPQSCDAYFDAVSTALDNINIYDAFGVCWNSSEQKALYQSPKVAQLLRKLQAAPRSFYTAAEYTGFLAVNPVGQSALGRHVRLVPPCVYAKPLVEYMNNASVRTALHIPAEAPAWDLCNDDINKNY